MNATLSRRLTAVEDKILPKVPQHLQHLLQYPPFVQMLGSCGVSVEDFQREGLAALPRDLLRVLVDRLKVAMTPAG